METTRINPNTLREAISVLHSNKEALKFLRSIHTSGSEITLNLMLELDDNDIDLVEEKLLISLEKNDINIINECGRKIIDYHIENNFIFSLPDKLKKWNNSELIQYTLNKISELQTEDVLEFYDKMDIENEASEKLLNIFLASHQSIYAAIHYLRERGRYKEAIEYCFKSKDIYTLRFVWQIAKENLPSLKRKAAEWIWRFEEYIKNIDKLIYVECAQELGYEKNVIEYLKKHIRNLKPTSIRPLYSLLEALKILHLQDEINKVLEIAEKYVESLEKMDIGVYEEIVTLYQRAGNNLKYKFWVTEKIKFESLECDTSHAINTIQDYEKETQDLSLRYLLFPVYERNKEYNKAEELATEIKMFEKAKKYSLLSELSEMYSHNKKINK